MPSSDTLDLLTVKEVAAILHVSKAHISNAVKGRVHGCEPLPAVRLGRRTLIRRGSLLSWIAQNEHSGGTIHESPERGVRNALRRQNA
jgi:excisionase family DNA binding protein